MNLQKLLDQCCYLFLIVLLLNSCAGNNNSKENQDKKKESTKNMESNYQKGTFGYDHDFVNHYSKAMILFGKDSNAMILVSPGLQGRVLTSSFGGKKGISLGYFNHSHIATDKVYPHSQGYGGEDRFWIGPQGGQYTIFFKSGDPFDFEHWFTPKAINSEPFEVVSADDSSITLKQHMEAKNYSGFQFDLKIKRKIKLINRKIATAYLGLSKLDDDIKYVGFESDNKLINAGEKPWDKETGLLSIWILGQFPAGATIVMPYQNGSNTEKPYTTYFKGLTPDLTPEQIKMDKKTIYYNGSGEAIGKIGLRHQFVTPFLGSYNPTTNVLTIIQYAYSKEDTDYVNSLWKHQKEPYSGDVINAYNDGSLDTSVNYSPTFYELETSSPTRELQPGESLSHYHRTFHFQGKEVDLNNICKTLLGTSLKSIEKQFP